MNPEEAQGGSGNRAKCAEGEGTRLTHLLITQVPGMAQPVTPASSQAGQWEEAFQERDKLSFSDSNEPAWFNVFKLTFKLNSLLSGVKCPQQRESLAINRQDPPHLK